MICIIACTDNKVFCQTIDHPRLAFGPLGHLSIHLIKMQMEILQMACSTEEKPGGSELLEKEKRAYLMSLLMTGFPFPDTVCLLLHEERMLL